MLTKQNTRIFIGTNIFLNLYNSNTSSSVEAFMKTLFKHRKALMTTEQAFNEFLRSRTRIIGQFKESFLAARTKEQTSSFVRALPGYDGYVSCLAELKNQHKNILEQIELTIADATKDFIYNGFMRLWKDNKLQTTPALFEAAARRKAVGDPPGGDKDTCGDELIWETLLQGLHKNLIVVSKDRTYQQNAEYLKYEYRQKAGLEFQTCGTVKEALALLDIQMDREAVGAEDDIKWLDIIIQAFKQLGGRGRLAEIYEECMDLVVLFYPDKTENHTIDSTVRRTIYEHSSDCRAYLGKEDLFRQAGPGVWELREKGG